MTNPIDLKAGPWTKFQGDFNALTDEQIEDITRDLQAKADEAEEWLEAVAAWEAAGRPRKARALQTGEAG